MSNVIHVTQLAKHYPAARGAAPVRAVDGIEFAVRAGEVFGFLGPNGAGKTTTIRMLTGLTRPTAGQARVLDFDLATDVTRIKKRIGVVPEMSNLSVSAALDLGALAAFAVVLFWLAVRTLARRVAQE